MSFKGNEEQSAISKRFVSETELEEIKKKREEEWELARQEGRQIEKEEDIIDDGRTLFERLKEQKDKKQEEFEEQLKFKNMIYKGLDTEDANFLSEVSSKQAEFHARRFDADDTELKSYRAAVETMRSTGSSKSSAPKKSTSKPSKTDSKSKIPSVIIRKRQSDSEQIAERKSKQAKGDTEEQRRDGHLDDKQESSENITTPKSSLLQGLIMYSDSDDESGDEQH